jgi:cystathionine gamma-lyase
MLEENVATIENGHDSIVVGTSMSATASCINAFMKTGDHCVITNCSYGGTNRICREQFEPFGMEFSFVDFTDPKNVEDAIRPNTKLIFSETPTNPTLTLVDLDAVSEIAKRHGIFACLRFDLCHSLHYSSSRSWLRFDHLVLDQILRQFEHWYWWCSHC